MYMYIYITVCNTFVKPGIEGPSKSPISLGHLSSL